MSNLKLEQQPEWRSEYLRSIAVALLTWLATRTALELIAGWSFLLDGHPAPWIHLWMQWDASYYVDVAVHGYHMPLVVTGNETGQSGLNFPPLLPMGIALTRLVIPSPLVAGLVFDNLCLIAASVLLHQLTRARMGVPAADWSVISLMLLPGSFALSGIMTEAPFLLFSIFTVKLAKSHPTLAAGSLSLLGLTRLTGIILLASVMLDWVVDRSRGLKASYRSLFLFTLSPLPLVFYAGYMFYVTGDALAIVHSHQAFWSLRQQFPFEGFLAFLGSPSPRVQVESFVAFSLLLILVSRWRLFSAGEWLFLLISVETSSSADGLVPSLIRYMIGLYPMHMAMAGFCRRHVAGRVALGIFAMINGALVIVWAHGRDTYQ